MRRLLNFLVAVVWLIGMASCLEDTSCGTNTETGLHFSMYKVQEVENGRFVIRNHTNVSVYEYNEYSDTVYPRLTDTLSMVPLELSDTLTNYVFQKDSLADRIIFVHSLPEPYLLDINCGFAPKYLLKGVYFTNNFIDSVYIVYPEVTADVFNTNVYIFYH